MFNKLKQIKDLKNQANQIKKALSEETVDGIGGSGKVKITIDGNQDVKKVEISEEALANKEALENAVKDAVNDSIKKAQKVMAEKISKMGGFNLPGM